MYIVKCKRCNGDATLNQNGITTGNQCLVVAKCNQYDCGGEQRHKFVTDDKSCDECQSTDLIPINNFEFISDDENNSLKQKLKCLNPDCENEWISTYTEIAVNLC